MLDPFLLLVIGWKMYKYVSKTHHRFGISISTGVRQLKFISLSLFERSFQVSFFFLDSRIQEAPIQSHRVFRNNACKARAPRKRKDTSFHPKVIGGSTNIWEGGGGGGVAASLVHNHDFSLESGTWCNPKKVQNGPFLVISLTRGGGGAPPATLSLKPPMKPVTNVYAETFPLRVVQKWFIYLIGRFHQFRHVLICEVDAAQWIDAAWYIRVQQASI